MIDLIAAAWEKLGCPGDMADYKIVVTPGDKREMERRGITMEDLRREFKGEIVESLPPDIPVGEEVSKESIELKVYRLDEPIE